MAQGHQRGWLKKERRSNGETWMLFFRTTRESDGKRVEQKVAVGTVRDLPTKASAWAERTQRQRGPDDGPRRSTSGHSWRRYSR